MQRRISVIVCTYNPDPSVFGRCLSSIATALERIEEAELLIIDNNSAQPVERLRLPPELGLRKVRFVREEVQGLTPARLRGIRESTGELIVFVDDDNFPRPDFFAEGLRIADEFPFIGSFSGKVELCFEKEPPEWTTPYHGMLVKRTFSRNIWSNLPTLDETMPCGAGLFVRRAAANHYLLLHDSGMRRIQLDRTGESLFSGGDNDLAACACDIGMGVGLFHELVIDHHIPASRLEKDYLLRLMRGIYTSSIVVKSLRGEKPQPYTFGRKVLDGLRLLIMDPLKRDFYRAQLRGEADGRKMIGM